MSEIQLWDRRTLLKTLSVALAATPLLEPGAALASDPLGAVPGSARATLEAYADTVRPGAARAGALALMAMPVLGIADKLPEIAGALDREAGRYASAHRLGGAGGPGFARLAPDHRTALAAELSDRSRPDRLTWVGLAMLSGIAHEHGPQLRGRPAPGEGRPTRWNPSGRAPAPLHPATTAEGHPA